MAQTQVEKDAAARAKKKPSMTDVAVPGQAGASIIGSVSKALSSVFPKKKKE